MGPAPYCFAPIAELSFSSFNNQVKILELQKNINDICSYYKSASEKIAASLGIPPQLCKLFDLLSNKDQIKEALIVAKIEVRIAENAVSQLNAKIHAIERRLEILHNQNTTNQNRQFEIVPAIHSCDEILHLFADHSYAFWRCPVATIPYLAAFLAVYQSILQMAIVILPNSYGKLEEERRRKEVRELIDNYKTVFWPARFAAIDQINNGDGTEWISFNGSVYDSYSSRENRQKYDCDASAGFERYKKELRSIYERYFETILQPF